MDYFIIEKVSGINFSPKPIAVPYNYRIVYKVAQIILILGMCCRKGACSLVKLHLISWGLSSKDEMENLIKLAYDCKGVPWPYLRFDPALNRALSFAVAEGTIIQNSNRKYCLTPKGSLVYKEIMDDNDLMIMEKDFLKNIATKLPEKKIEGLLADWRFFL